MCQVESLHRHLIVQPNVERVRALDDRAEVELVGDDDACCKLLADLVGAGYRVLEFRPLQADLEDIFMTVTRGDVQ
jgi:ABC-2 type transport system ATP-binding protein